ncbi:MAG: hypothetical protein HYW02_00960 [Deltaproteobacteria bacterium]|nr:hypothetical protein [Deltaproteobacteria bacterium]MBI4197238.1 hypothetical protein [Deltaproteobacteria bacterium]
MQSDQFGTMLESLSFEAEGEASNQQPAVLSCGGIFFPQSDLPKSLRFWTQVVNLPHEEISAKIFGVKNPDGQEMLVKILQKETLN